MELVLSILFWAATVVGAFFAGGTLLSFSRHAHWIVRGWDFPRLQIATVLLLSGLLHAALANWHWYSAVFLGVVGACTAWQFYKIFPYTKLAREEVQRARGPAGASSLRLVASNVQMESEQHEHWLEVIRAADPDVILVLEVNRRWMEHIEVLAEDYPYVVRRPQENYYGLVLFSRLELTDPEVLFIVDPKVPSVHTGITLRSGEQIYFHGVHPRPPEPIRGTSSVQRDAEIVVMGHEIREADDEHAWKRPTIIAGDFNDVAWSRTTELFMRLSGLLDPRKGRGLLDSFDANSRWFRYPVDHVFHSDEFGLSELRLLEYVGSDHFPVFIELCYEPSAETATPTAPAHARDEKDAEEAIGRAESEGNNVNRDPI